MPKVMDILKEVDILKQKDLLKNQAILKVQATHNIQLKLNIQQILKAHKQEELNKLDHIHLHNQLINLLILLLKLKADKYINKEELRVLGTAIIVV